MEPSGSWECNHSSGLCINHCGALLCHPPSFKPNLLCRSVATAPLAPPCWAFLLCLQSLGVAEAASPLQGLVSRLVCLPEGSELCWGFLQGQVSSAAWENWGRVSLAAMGVKLPCSHVMEHLWGGWVHVGHVLLHRSTKRQPMGLC